MAEKIQVCPLSFICHPGDLFSSFGDKVFSVTVERYFWRIYGGKWERLDSDEKKGKIRQKYLSTVNDITLSPKNVMRSSGWHMKDNGHTYLFSARYFFGNKYNVGARLDQIRHSQFVMDLWSQFSVDSQQKWLKISENAYIGDK